MCIHCIYTCPTGISCCAINCWVCDMNACELFIQCWTQQINWGHLHVQQLQFALSLSLSLSVCRRLQGTTERNTVNLPGYRSGRLRSEPNRQQRLANWGSRCWSRTSGEKHFKPVDWSGGQETCRAIHAGVYLYKCGSCLDGMRIRCPRPSRSLQSRSFLSPRPSGLCQTRHVQCHADCTNSLFNRPTDRQSANSADLEATTPARVSCRSVVIYR
jgi:hypothetical protein